MRSVDSYCFQYIPSNQFSGTETVEVVWYDVQGLGVKEEATFKVNSYNRNELVNEVGLDLRYDKNDQIVVSVKSSLKERAE